MKCTCLQWARSGSALVLVMCIAGALSVLMLRMYARASLLLQTVVYREQDATLRYAAEALLVHAANVAKQDWHGIIAAVKKTDAITHVIDWQVREGKKGEGTFVFKSAGKEELFVQAMLDNDTRTFSISCVLKPVKDGLVIREWKEGA